MIDWGGLAANALWIMGCAVALAVFSYASWQASLSGLKWLIQIKQPAYQAGLSLAGVLFSAGLSVTSGSALNTVLWAILGAAFFVQLIFNARLLRSAR